RRDARRSEHGRLRVQRRACLHRRRARRNDADRATADRRSRWKRRRGGGGVVAGHARPRQSEARRRRPRAGEDGLGARAALRFAPDPRRCGRVEGRDVAASVCITRWVPSPGRQLLLDRVDLLGAQRRQGLRARRAAHHPCTDRAARQELHVRLTTLLAVRLRDLPSVDELTRGIADPLAVDAARSVLARAREEIRAGADPGDLASRVRDELAAAPPPTLRRVSNAPGVIVHTNLGRAPLAEDALARVSEAARGYSNLEYDLAGGTRGSRQDHVAGLLRYLTGADAALVVNNNAAAVMLALAALAEGRDVIVSRGELIEIGDGFRIPDVLARSGARLREVGTTNRTRADDYERAVTDETALLLRVHQSNFRVVGFTEQPRVEELAAIARRHGLPLVDDLGSGALVDVGDEPTAREALAGGADLVCFSGDKLLGGPQAGIVVGRSDLVERLRRHPLQRALRADKLTLAALEGTLALYLDEPERIPVLRMLRQDTATIRARAERLAAAAAGEGGTVEETVSRVGGGALPLAELPSFACAVDEHLATPLRLGEPSVVAVVRDGKLLLDCRTIRDDEV